MKKRNWIVALLTAAMVTGMMTACGDDTASTSASGESAAVSSQEGSATDAADAGGTSDSANAQTEYAFQDATTGFSILNWTGTFADLYASENAYVIAQAGETSIDTVKAGLVYVICMDLPEGFDENAEGAQQEKDKYYSEIVFAPVLFTDDPDMTKDDIQALLDADEDARFAGCTLTEFRTSGGHNIFQLSGFGEGTTYSEYASDETKQALEALESEWETQRAQIEIAGYQGTEGITFNATDYNGASVNESIFKNAKLTMVNIWATTCNPCIREMPDLQKLNDNIADFQVVTIVCDVTSLDDTDGIDEAKNIMETQGAGSLPVLLGSEELDMIFKYTGTPTSYLVDSNGNIVDRPVSGSYNEGNYEHLETWVTDVMNQL
jgi:thiol-disulfide isomerase/thioredoxin